MRVIGAQFNVRNDAFSNLAYGLNLLFLWNLGQIIF